MHKMIPLSRPDITRLEIEYVNAVLRRPYLSLGPMLGSFENKFSSYIGTKYAVAVNSGTSALHLIIRSLGISSNDEVITTPFSFVASANCIIFEKARPVFVDIEDDSLTINPDLIEKSITSRTKALLVVDIFGQPARWERIINIAKKHNLKVIEDSCEALGAVYKGKKCGMFGNAAAFAFYPNKQITTGEGGMIVTDNRLVAQLCRSMSNQGRKLDNKKWLEHVRLGYNYRMDELSAALGLAQMARIDEISKKREVVAGMYSKKLSSIEEIELPYRDDDSKNSWFVYVVRLVKRSFNKKTRGRIITALSKKGIQCSDYFQPIHLQPFYRKQFAYRPGDFPVTENISSRTIALPFYTNLKESQINYVVNSLKGIISKEKC